VEADAHRLEDLEELEAGAEEVVERAVEGLEVERGVHRDLLAEVRLEEVVRGRRLVRVVPIGSRREELVDGDPLALRELDVPRGSLLPVLEERVRVRVRAVEEQDAPGVDLRVLEEIALLADVREVEDLRHGVGRHARPAVERIALELRARAEGLDLLALEALLARAHPEDDLGSVLEDDAALHLRTAREDDAVGDAVVAEREGESEREDGVDRREHRLDAEF